MLFQSTATRPLFLGLASGVHSRSGDETEKSEDFESDRAEKAEGQQRGRRQHMRDNLADKAGRVTPIYCLFGECLHGFLHRYVVAGDTLKEPSRPMIY